jgi:hypothetical protein
VYICSVVFSRLSNQNLFHLFYTESNILVPFSFSLTTAPHLIFLSFSHLSSSNLFLVLPYLISSIFTGLEFSNYCDIGKASNRLINQQKQTLRYLQFFFFGEQILPPAYVKLSDWSVDTLEYEQVRYAAYDALMCRQIYDEIRTRGTSQLFLRTL